MRVRVFLLLILGPTAVCRAHEVDSYTLPLDRKLIDLGDFWNQMLCEAVHRGARSLNREIDQLQKAAGPLLDSELRQLRSPPAIAGAVQRELPNGWRMIEGLELQLRLQNRRYRGSGWHLHHKAWFWESAYRGVPAPDPQLANRLFLMRSSLVRVHGQLLGTDKLGHFVGLGSIYYHNYWKQRSFGVPRAQARRTAIECGAKGLLSEMGMFGKVTTGIYSNADMAANYSGFKFFCNLTEPVTLQGVVRRPMLELQNGRWVVRPEVRPDTPYFAVYISAHWDEVLNPSHYAWQIRLFLRPEVKAQRQQLLTRYANSPEKRNPEYFAYVLRQLSTYYGEDYGHSGDFKTLMTLGDLCFE